MAKLPVSNLVNVQVNLGSSAAQSQNLTSILVLGTSDVIDSTQRLKQYSTLASVAADFGTTAPEYYAATEWFSQSPQPKQLLIGAWNKTATKARAVGAVVPTVEQSLSVWNAITNGGFEVVIDGIMEAVTGLDFSTVSNLNGVASIIDLALPSATCTWNAAYNQFELKTISTGVDSLVTLLTAPTTGTDISLLTGLSAMLSGAYWVLGADAETAIDAVALFDDKFGQQWYGLFICEASDADHLAVAEYIEGSNTKHAYAVNTTESGVLVGSDTTNIAFKLKALNYKKTLTQYSSNSEYAAVSLMARILTTDYTANNTVITLMYKQEPGVVAESLAASQMTALLANNCNVFVNYDNNTAIIQPGVVASGDFIDTIFGADWLAIDIQNTVYNLLYTTPTKIPQTNKGNGIIAAGIISVLEKGVANGLLAPGTWMQTGFGTLNYGDYLPKGYYVYAPDIALQNPADRAARRSVTFQVAAKLAGAVHTVDIMVNINR